MIPPDALPPLPPRRKPSELGSPNASLIGTDYSDEERALLTQVDRYRRKYRRPHLTLRELLDVFKSLGYARP